MPVGMCCLNHAGGVLDVYAPFLRWKHLGSSTLFLEIGDIKSMILAAFPVNATEHEAEDLHGHKVRWCCQL